jgi:hypothetical protein
MRLSDLSRRHKIVAALAGAFAVLGAVATFLTTQPALDRSALARLAAEAAADPIATGSTR